MSDTEIDPEEVIARVRAGDIDAYALLVERYEGLLLGFACQRLGDPTQARDIAQLTFLRAYEQLADFRPGANFGTWLCVICKYMILTELERRRREKRNVGNYEGDLREMISDFLVEDSEPDDEGLAALVALRRCVKDLGGNTAELVRMRYHREMSCKEIAAAKGRTVTWVTTTLARVRGKLSICVKRQTRQQLS